MTKEKDGIRFRKKLVPLLLLLLLLFLLIAAYALLLKSNEKKEADKNKTEDTIILSSVDADEITRIEYTNEAGSTTLQKKNDKWENISDTKEELDQTKVDSMLAELSEVKAEKLVIETAEDLGEFGLLTPSLFIDASLENGSVVSLMIGDTVPGSSERYACLAGESKIYTVSSSIYTAFLES